MRCFSLLAVLAIVAIALTSWAHDAGDSATAAKPGERSLQVLKAFPVDPGAYRDHTAELVRRGVPEQYGHEEWAAVVMAHEFHQHVGIMTIVGAKMAVRAKELLDAPARAIRVVSETGPEPPFSCAVDGMQAAIGSTYAQQLIEAPPVDSPRLAATFQYDGRTVRLTLKPEYHKRIAQCIQAAIKTHGDLSPAYFEEIQDFSYHVWEDFDRKTIFVEEDPSTPKE